MNIFEEMKESHEICRMNTNLQGTEVYLRPIEIKHALKDKLSESDIEQAYDNIKHYNDFMEIKRNLYNNCKVCNCKNNATLFHSIPFGNINAKVMFINKMPTQYETCSMHCMSDVAGTFLSLILNKMNIKREDVYMTDMIKCNAQLDEFSFKECINTYLKKEIEIISPKFIICNGISVLKTCIKNGIFTNLPQEVRYGNIYNANDFNVMAMYDLDTVLQKTGEDYAKCKDELWHQILNAFREAYKDM